MTKRKAKTLTPLDRVLERAAELGLSQNELQRRAGLQAGLIANARRGGGLSLASLQALAPVLGVTVGALLGETPPPVLDAVYRRIPLDDLCFDTLTNERRHDDPLATANLAENIAANGLLQNLVVYADEGGSWRVAAGSRRLQALILLAQWHRLPADLKAGIPCRVLPNRATALVATVVENLQRADTHFLDRGKAFDRLRRDLKWSSAQIAQAVHCSPRLVQQLLQIHDHLPAPERAAAKRGELSFTEARDLVQEKQVKTAANPPPAKEAVAEAPPADDDTDDEPGLPFGPSEAAKPTAAAKPVQTPPPARRDPNIVGLERELEEALGLRTTIAWDEKKGGSLTLAIRDLDQFDLVLDRLLERQRPGRGG